MDPNFDPLYADDIIYGGLGSDWLHGGSGDDLVVGAEALEVAYFEEFAPYSSPDGSRTGTLARSDYTLPYNPGNALGFEARKAEEFAAYDEYNPLRKIVFNEVITGGVVVSYDEFFANFDRADTGAPQDGVMEETGVPVYTDGNDKIFGDLGNDWLVGGTGRDNIYGGFGNDLLNADDDHESVAQPVRKVTDPLGNNTPDTAISYQDIAYGGAGRDVLIGNTGGDRLIDWVGEFNSYLVPFAPFGMATVSRTLQPQLADYLYDLSENDGADTTRTNDIGIGADPERNGEPFGELGVVRQQDPWWKPQTGAPDDPQAGNIPGGKRDVLRSVGFNNGNPNGFFIDSGTWTVQSGSYYVEPDFKGGDALSVFNVDAYTPNYFEMLATLKPVKPTGGFKSNAYVVFDYQSATDFKFAGINVSTNKLEIGHRTAEGWIVDVQGVYPGSLKSDTAYNILLAVNGTTVTLMVDNKVTLTHQFEAVYDQWGILQGLNDGLVGLGGDNSKAAIDNVIVQRLAPEISFTDTDSFTNSVGNLFTVPESGVWNVTGGFFTGIAGAQTAVTLMSPDVAAAYLVRLSASLQTTGEGGLVFDYYGPETYKFVSISSETSEIVIGHRTSKGVVADAVYTNPYFDFSALNDLEIILKGTTISVTFNGALVSGFVYNALVTDGGFGLLGASGSTAFDEATFQTDDPALGTITDPGPGSGDEPTPISIIPIYRQPDSGSVDQDPALVEPEGSAVDSGDDTATGSELEVIRNTIRYFGVYSSSHPMPTLSTSSFEGPVLRNFSILEGPDEDEDPFTRYLY
jgi:hypothetical protein